jgi:hypothetical protein
MGGPGGCFGLVAIAFHAQTAGTGTDLSLLPAGKEEPVKLLAANSLARRSRSRYLEMIRLIRYLVGVRPIPSPQAPRALAGLGAVNYRLRPSFIRQ